MKTEGSPDLVVEILSSSTSHLDRVGKKELYCALTIPEFWLVDPIAHAVEQLILRDNAYDWPAVMRTRSRSTFCRMCVWTSARCGEYAVRWDASGESRVGSPANGRRARYHPRPDLRSRPSRQPFSCLGNGR